MNEVLDSILAAKGPATLWLESKSELIRKWIEEDRNTGPGRSLPPQDHNSGKQGG